MSIIDSTYFIRDINLPSGAFSDLDLYIETYEKEMLIKLLGYSLYAEFIAGIADPSPAQKWLDLRDGLTYTYAGKTVRWNGLKNTDKISPIAYYVFCKYVVSKQIAQTQTGANLPKQENSTVADNVPKLVNAWNSFLSLYGYSGQSAYEGSALNFLLAHSDTYDSYTTLFNSANIYGL